MVLKGVITLAAVLLSVCADDPIPSLSFEALETTVGAEEHVLVLFYAPWCFWSRQLLPEFQEAAQRLRHHDPPVHLVKIDASADSHAQDKYEISEFPTLRFFVDGIGHEYQGGRTAAKIIQWVNAYLDREIEIKTPEQAEDFVHHRVASALAIFSPSSSSKKGTGEASELTEMGGETEGLFKKAFKHSAQRHSEMHFGITESASVIEYIRSTRGLKELKAPSLVVFKPHDEGREVAVWNEPVKALADYKSIDKFVLSHKLPRVVSLTPDTAENIFEDGRPVLAVFEKEKDRDPQIEAELKAVADSFPSEILVILGGSSHQHEKRLIGMLGGDPDDEEKFPLVRLFTKNAAGSSHFHPTLKFDFKGPLRRSPLGKFVSDFLGDKLQPFYMSEDAPEDHTQGGLTTVVGSTFSSLVRDPSKDAIVEFFAPWCGHCRKLEPVWRELATRFRKSRSVLVGKMDATRNEVPGLTIDGYPTIYLFPAGVKEPVEFTGSRTVEELTDFLVKSGTNSNDIRSFLQAPDEESDDDDLELGQNRLIEL